MAAPKPPLAEPEARLQAVFDGLRTNCAALAPTPQVKRKLEDVQRRLETLYDMLRENRLSANALSSLHACAEAARAQQYSAALQQAAALATGPDFAAVASFLPGLKALLQLAAGLQPPPPPPAS